MAVLELSSYEPKQVGAGTQVILFFGDYELSIINDGYGADQGLYEIGVFNGNTMVSLPGITEEHDTVKGWLTEADVDSIIKKMYFLTGKTPRQI
jgi:hypothetical protein